MLDARLRKAMSDVRASGTRTLLAMAAMALGVVGAGSVWSAYVVLEREMAADFARTRPAPASLWTEPVDDALVDRVRRAPGVRDAEARRTLTARAQVGQDQWKPLLLFVVRDFADLRLDVFEPEQGRFPPGTGEILLERVAPRVIPAHMGDELVVQVPGNPAAQLTMVGTVHAAGLAPAWMEGMGYGFITQATAASLGGPADLDEIKVAFAGVVDRAEISARAHALARELAAEGHAVLRVEVHEPGEHPHASQLATLLFLLEAFGLLALGLSAVLVASMISSLLAQQVRQIGVMKAIGASTGQVAFNYFTVVAILGLAASGPALGASLGIGRLYSGLVAKMLNFDLADASVPWTVLGLQAAVGVAVPLLVSAWPIWRGTRISVREALCDYGVPMGAQDGATALLQRIRALPASALYALRGLARGRRRLALTAATLSIGGATFLAAANIGAAMEAMVGAKFDAQPYDLLLTFARPQPSAEVPRLLAGIPGVEQAEAWGGGWASRIRPDASLGKVFRVFAPPARSRLSGVHEIVEGRWLTAEDRDAVVVNQMLLAAEPDLRVGSRVELSVQGRSRRFVLVGVVRERMSPMVAYTNYEAWSDGLGAPGLAQVAVVSSANRGGDATTRLAQAVERELQARGIAVAALLQTAEFRKAVEDHLLVIGRVLLAMSLLVVAVGGLGLTSAMSIRILERTRELGVVRALGASNADLLRIVMLEAVAIGVVSWLTAAALTVPMSAWMSRMFGTIFFAAPLEFTVSSTGLALWLALVIAVACAASALPVMRATRVPVARALSYE